MNEHFTLAYYVIDVLKYLSVPAAAFEFLSEKKKQQIEHWIVRRLPKVLKTFAITFVITTILVLVLIYAGSWLILLYFFIGRLIAQFDNDGYQDGDFAEFFYISIGIALILAPIQHWVLPDSWNYALAYPIELVFDTLNQSSHLDPLIPNFSSEGFIVEYEYFFERFKEMDLKWWQYPFKIYLFATKGFMLLMILIIDIALLIAIVALIFLIIFVPFNMFIKVSTYLKKVFAIKEGNIPLGAFLIWGMAESIFIILRSIEILGK